MHEAGVAERLLEVVLERAAGSGATRVVAVELETGPESGVSEEAVRFHWAEVARGTPAEGAALRVVPVAEATAFRVVAIEVPDETLRSEVGTGRV